MSIMSVSETFWRSSNAGGSLDKVLFKVDTAPTHCLVLTSLGFLTWNLMCHVCCRSTSRGAKNVMSCCSTMNKLAAVSLPTARACSLNLSNAVPVRHPRQCRCCNGPVVTLFPITPSLMRRTPCRTSRTLDGLSNGLNFPLITGDDSFVGSVLIVISLMVRSHFENAGALSRISWIMMGPWRFRSFDLPLEKPLGFFSFLECFILRLKAFCFLFATTSRWLFVSLSLTREHFRSLVSNRLGFELANPVE
jgi:hypothetical protein